MIIGTILKKYDDYVATYDRAPESLYLGTETFIELKKNLMEFFVCRYKAPENSKWIIYGMRVFIVNEGEHMVCA